MGLSPDFQTEYLLKTGLCAGITDPFITGVFRGDLRGKFRDTYGAAACTGDFRRCV